MGTAKLEIVSESKSDFAASFIVIMGIRYKTPEMYFKALSESYFSLLALWISFIDSKSFGGIWRDSAKAPDNFGLSPLHRKMHWEAVRDSWWWTERQKERFTQQQRRQLSCHGSSLHEICPQLGIQLSARSEGTSACGLWCPHIVKTWFQHIHD